MSTYEDKLTGRLPPQSWLHQRYLIVGLAGRGGMSAVYKGVDTQQGNRSVAIKEMSQGHLSETERQEAIARFQQEYLMLNRLKHPNLPQIVDTFEEGDRFYFVMDFIEGKTLYELLRSNYGSSYGSNYGQALPVMQVVEYALQLCDVLAYLHIQQPPIIFRDLKPTNIMIRPDGRLFLIDFGIARIFKEGQAQDTVLLGSPGYAPPEQHGTAQTSPRSDIYGLGATLHFALTGNDPFHATQRFVFFPIRQYSPAIPAELDSLVLRMLALDERSRPSSALEVKQALLAIKMNAADATSNLPPTLASAPTQYAQLTVNAAPTFPPAQPVRPVVAATQLAQPITVSPSSSASSSWPWSRRFLALFIAMMAVTVIGSVIAFNISNPYGVDHLAGLDHAVELALASLFVVIALASCTFVRGAFNIAILFASALVMVSAMFGTLVQTIRDINPFQSPLFLSPLNPLPLVTAGLVAAPVISLLWALRTQQPGQRIALFVMFGAAVLCALISAVAITLDGDLNHHLLLLASLILSIQGLLIAAQLARLNSHSR